MDILVVADGSCDDDSSSPGSSSVAMTVKQRAFKAMGKPVWSERQWEQICRDFDEEDRVGSKKA